ncbi:MAG: hypothetical protein VXY49_03370 [Verrucomicrobiota bacterium]|nr:hypothetical protein [Verrucomicrobiota bacterium]
MIINSTLTEPLIFFCCKNVGYFGSGWKISFLVSDTSIEPSISSTFANNSSIGSLIRV